MDSFQWEVCSNAVSAEKLLFEVLIAVDSRLSGLADNQQKRKKITQM